MIVSERTEKGPARCYLIGAGEFGDGFVPPEPGDLTIACDGGILSCREKGIKPDLVIGDFDSLGYVPEEKDVIKLPVRKDVTDLWAAYEEASGRGFREFMIYGAAGGPRPSHTMANIQMLAHMVQNGCRPFLFGKGSVYTAVSCGKLVFHTAGIGHVSVFSLSERSSGVSIKGLSYELEDAELGYLFPLGVGNYPEKETACISVENGILLVIAEKE